MNPPTTKTASPIRAAATSVRAIVEERSRRHAGAALRGLRRSGGGGVAGALAPGRRRRRSRRWRGGCGEGRDRDDADRALTRRRALAPPSLRAPRPPRAARTPGSAPPAAAGTSDSGRRRGRAGTSRTTSRACCGPRAGGGSCRTGRRAARHRAGLTSSALGRRIARPWRSLPKQLQWRAVATFLRLLTFLRPYKRGVWLSGALAALAMGATVAIPALTGAAINAVEAKDGDQLKLLALLIAAAGLVRLGLTVARRLVAGRRLAGRRVRPAQPLYEHLLSLELGFFDRQQTGQLMSRATVDLQAVRFFLGYGLVFIVQSRADDRLRRDRDARHRPGARADLAVARAVRDLDRAALRPPLAAGAAGGPAADRRADRRRRGERRRRARRQGVRPRGSAARALPGRASRASSSSR